MGGGVRQSPRAEEGAPVSMPALDMGGRRWDPTRGREGYATASRRKG
jgi:hypothetical protein